MNKGRDLAMMVQEGGPRRDASSAEQSRGRKVWFVIQSNVLRASIDKDAHHGSMGQMGAMKYLRENCYHCIECFVTNSLAALMSK